MNIKALMFFATVSIASFFFCGGPASAEEGESVASMEEGKKAAQPGPAPANRETSYWDNGKVKEDKIYDDNATLRKQAAYREDGTIENFKKFDSEGNMIEDVHYNEEGRLEETADGWAAMTFEYKNGNLITENYYGADGKMTERKVYGDDGVLMAKQYAGDGNIDPYEEYDPAPVINHEEENSYYDEYGRLEGTTSVVD